MGSWRTRYNPSGPPHAMSAAVSRPRQRTSASKLSGQYRRHRRHTQSTAPRSHPSGKSKLNKRPVSESGRAILNVCFWVFVAPKPPVATWSTFAANRADCASETRSLWRFRLSRLSVFTWSFRENAFGNRFRENVPLRRPTARSAAWHSSHRFVSGNAGMAVNDRTSAFEPGWFRSRSEWQLSIETAPT